MDTAEYSGGGRGGYRGRGGGSGDYYDNRRGGGYDGGWQGGRGGGDGYHFQQRGGRGGGYRGGRSDYYQPQGRGGGFYNNDYDNSWRGGRSGGGNTGRGSGRYHNNWGRGGYRNNTYQRRQEREEETLPNDIIAVVELPAHTKKVSAMQVDIPAQQLYTGSHDGFVKCWSTSNGQCTSNVDVGGEVDSLLLSGGFLFVGVHKGGEGIIKIWNMSTGHHHQLPGHKGQILCMVAAGGLLFSGGQDHSIRVWNFNAQAGIFMSQATITKAEGGHAACVHALQSYGSFLFSADRSGTIKVWDLNTGQVAQTLQNAHSDAIMAMLLWDSYVLTASMDGLIKAWQILEQPVGGMVLKTEPEFSFNRETAESSDQQQYRRPRGSDRGPPGIATMAGTLDASGTPVLMVAYLMENFVRLYELPSFASRGVLTPAADSRTLGMMLTSDFTKGHMMMAGDGQGRLRIFGWKTA